MQDTIERSQVHATFVIEREYPAPVDQVWHALSDASARREWFGGRHISTSLQTMVLEPTETGTRLTLTEQAVHLDGLDTAEGREEGTRGLLDHLGSYLAR